MTTHSPMDLRGLAEKAIEARKNAEAANLPRRPSYLAAAERAFDFAATPEAVLELLDRLTEANEWLKSRDEQIQRNYLKALDDGDRITALEAALKPFADGASHTRVFLTTREKMHQTGIEIFDEDVNIARAALASRETK